MSSVVVDIELKNGDNVVVTSRVVAACAFHPEVVYDVSVNGTVRHPNCTPEDVMRALANYLQGK